MKNTILFIFSLLVLGVSAQNVNIPDANFKAYLVGEPTINTSGDSEIQVSEAAAYSGQIDCSSMNVSSLTGIEAFTLISSLNCNDNQISSIDISNNTDLVYFYCDSNLLTYLDLSLNNSIQYFSCELNQIESLNLANGANNITQVINVTENPNLTCVQIDAGYTPHSFWLKDPVTSWNSNCSISCFVHIPDANFKAYLVGNTAINTNGNNEIECSEASAFSGSMYCNFLSISDMTGIETFTALTVLSCYNNSLTSLDVSNNTALIQLSCYNNSLTSINVSNNLNLTHLYCYSNDLTSINVSNNTSLEQLFCYDNALTSIDVSNNTSLTGLDCVENAITSIDVSNNTVLTGLYCRDNSLTSLDVSANTLLTHFNCADNGLVNLNVANGNNTNFAYYNSSNNPNLTCIQVDDATYSTTNWTNIDATASFSTNCVSAPCTVNIPDANFKAYLVGNTAINTNGNTEIECSEASTFTGQIICSNLSISDLTGIEAFTALTTLNCYSNQLNSLDISNNNSLTDLNCSINSLSSLDVSNNTSLTTLSCSLNSLTAIDVSNNTSLSKLYCSSTLLTVLDVSSNTNLTTLDCANNSLTTLDLTSNTLLEVFGCENNSLMSLDLAGNAALIRLYCQNNSLTSLNVANGNNINVINFNATGNPNLMCIQVDDATYSTTNWTDIDVASSFSTNCSSASLEEDDSSIEFFPNPTSGLVTINTISKLQGVEVYSLTGKRIKNFVNSNKLDISNLPAGIYFVTVITEDGKTTSKKLIKE